MGATDARSAAPQGSWEYYGEEEYQLGGGEQALLRELRGQHEEEHHVDIYYYQAASTR